MSRVDVIDLSPSRYGLSKRRLRRLARKHNRRDDGECALCPCCGYPSDSEGDHYCPSRGLAPDFEIRWT